MSIEQMSMVQTQAVQAIGQTLATIQQQQQPPPQPQMPQMPRDKDAHYRNLALCRVPYSLPSVLFRALGKELFAECHAKKPSVKENTRRRSSLPSVLFLTLGKEFLCRVFF
jgi:hypothetical protein